MKLVVPWFRTPEDVDIDRREVLTVIDHFACCEIVLTKCPRTNYGRVVYTRATYGTICSLAEMVLPRVVGVRFSAPPEGWAKS